MLAKTTNIILLTLVFAIKLSAQSNTIKIGSQEWANKNLSIEFFRNGDKIFQANSIDEIKKAEKSKTPLWWYYDFNPKNGILYGKMYNWWAIIDERGLAPTGFKIPNKIDFDELFNLTEGTCKHLRSKTGWKNLTSGGTSRVDCPNCKNWSNSYKLKVACHKCKDNRYIDVEIPESKININGTDKYGFNGLPGGKLNCVTLDYISFDEVGYDCIYWAPHDNNGKNEQFNTQDYYLGGKRDRIDSYSIYNCEGQSRFQAIGAYVRCIKAKD